MILSTGRCTSEMNTSGSNLGKAVRPDKLATQLSILSSAYCCAREHHVPISLAPKEVACPRTLTPATTRQSAVVDSYVVRQERDVICRTSPYITPRNTISVPGSLQNQRISLSVGPPRAADARRLVLSPLSRDWWHDSHPERKCRTPQTRGHHLPLLVPSRDVEQPLHRQRRAHCPGLTKLAADPWTRDVTRKGTSSPPASWTRMDRSTSSAPTLSCFPVG
jgi:hypothetical protein